MWNVLKCCKTRLRKASTVPIPDPLIKQKTGVVLTNDSSSFFKVASFMVNTNIALSANRVDFTSKLSLCLINTISFTAKTTAGYIWQGWRHVIIGQDKTTFHFKQRVAAFAVKRVCVVYNYIRVTVKLQIKSTNVQGAFSHRPFFNTTPVFCFISGSGIGTVEAFPRRFLQHFRTFHTQSVFFQFHFLHR